MTADFSDTLKPEKPVDTARDAGVQMAKGSAWMVAMRWVVRLLGLVSTVILARLLAPEDFGLFAIAMLVIGFSELVGKAGQELAIIRHPDPTRDHMDSAWTASIGVSCALGTLVLLSAPLIADVFNEPRAELLINVLSIRVFMTGFENIGVVMFRRNLNFGKEFRYGIYQKLLKVLLVIALAFALKNYWALIFGSLFGHLLFIGVSYLVHPYRPRICLSKIPEIWSFSMWILVSLIGDFFRGRIDRFVIGAVASTSAMGFYHIGSDLGRMPTFEIVQPTSRALIPTYSKLTNDLEELKKAFLAAFGIIAYFCFSAGIGFALIAENFVVVVYGEKWAPAVPIVVWISLTAGATAIINTANPVQTATGHSKTIAVMNWLHGLILAASLAVVVSTTIDLGMIAAARLGATIIVAPIFFIVLARTLPVKATDLLLRLWRPALASLIMAGAITAIPEDPFNGNRIALLLLQLTCGSITFIGVGYLLWAMSGRQSGAEATLIKFAQIARWRLIHSK